MPDPVGGDKLLYDSPVLLVASLIETTDHGLVLFCGHRSASSYVK
jgi:hypothetical protein